MIVGSIHVKRSVIRDNVGPVLAHRIDHAPVARLHSIYHALKTFLLAQTLVTNHCRAKNTTAHSDATMALVKFASSTFPKLVDVAEKRKKCHAVLL